METAKLYKDLSTNPSATALAKQIAELQKQLAAATGGEFIGNGPNTVKQY